MIVDELLDDLMAYVELQGYDTERERIVKAGVKAIAPNILRLIHKREQSATLKAKLEARNAVH